MKNKYSQHPVITCAEEISAICRPLAVFDISYFCHVHIDSKNKFSGISNNPAFAEHYLKNKYYNADIHMANETQLDKYIMWDFIENTHETDKMNQEGSEFGVKHAFTIVDCKPNGDDFYHFATHLNKGSINQVYVSNLDLLKKFISHFHEKVKHSKILSSAYQFQYTLDTHASGFSTKDSSILSDVQKRKSAFMDFLTLDKTKNQQPSLLHKDTQNPMNLTPQQTKCLHLLLKGYSNKKIACELKLSTRTVDHYLERLRILLGCRNSKEMIAAYAATLFHM